MKLFTKEINNKLFAQYPKGNDLDSQLVVTKIFNPYGKGRWFLLNSDPQDPDYLWAIVQMGDIVEVGSVLRSELESLRVSPYKFPLERDLGFRMVNAGELYRGLQQGKFYNKGGTIQAAKGMEVGRYYKDKSGNSFRYIGENMQGDTLFNDGERVIVKSTNDFEEEPNKKSRFSFFEDGGIMDKGGMINKYNISFNYNPSNLSNEAAEKIVEKYTKNWKHNNDFDEVSFYVLGVSNDKADMLVKELKMEDVYNIEVDNSSYKDGGMMAKGGKIKLGDIVEVEEPNYGYDDSYYVVNNKAGYDENGFLISPTRARLGDVFEKNQLKKIMADGGMMAKGGATKKIEVIVFNDKKVEYTNYDINEILDDNYLYSSDNLPKWLIAVRNKGNKNFPKNKEEVVSLLKKIVSTNEDVLIDVDSNKPAYLNKIVIGREQMMADGGFVDKTDEELKAMNDDELFAYLDAKAAYMKQYARPLSSFKAKNFAANAAAVQFQNEGTAKLDANFPNLSKINQQATKDYEETIAKRNKIAGGGKIDKKIVVELRGGKKEYYDNAEITEMIDNYEDFWEADNIPKWMYMSAMQSGDFEGIRPKLKKAKLKESVINVLQKILDSNGDVYINVRSDKPETNGIVYSTKMAGGGIFDNESSLDLNIIENMPLRDKIKVFKYLDNYNENTKNTLEEEFGYTKSEAEIIEKAWAKSRGYKMAGGGFTSSFSGTPDRRRVTKEKGGYMAKGVETKLVQDPKTKEFSRRIIMKPEDIETIKKIQDMMAKEKSNFRAKNNMAKGGEATFKDKVKAIKASLLKTKKVPTKVQKDYGKIYNSKEAEEAAKRIAGAMRKKEKMEEGGLLKDQLKYKKLRELENKISYSQSRARDYEKWREGIGANYEDKWNKMMKRLRGWNAYTPMGEQKTKPEWKEYCKEQGIVEDYNFGDVLA